MYNEEYKRWMAADLEDADLKPELSKIEGNDEEIKERFDVSVSDLCAPLIHLYLYLAGRLLKQSGVSFLNIT